MLFSAKGNSNEQAVSDAMTRNFTTRDKDERVLDNIEKRIFRLKADMDLVSKNMQLIEDLEQ